MLKKMFLTLSCVAAALSAYCAQLTATLQSGDKFTPFYGANAFKEAHEAAVDGDVITLSAGQFNSTAVTKAVTVIGVYAHSDDMSKATQFNSFTVTSDDVTLEGIRFGGSFTIKGADNLTISRCYIQIMYDGENGEDTYHKNTIVKECVVYECKAMTRSEAAVFKNSCINYFSDVNESSKLAIIENCNLPCFCRNSYSANDGSYKQPYAIYRNCYLGLYNYQSSSPSLTLYTPSEFQNCYFATSTYASTSSSANYKPITVNFNGCVKENTIVRSAVWCSNVASYSSMPYWSNMNPVSYNDKNYGPENPQMYPAIPSITSAEIDSETDAEGKLHIKINATARN